MASEITLTLQRGVVLLTADTRWHRRHVKRPFIALKLEMKTYLPYPFAQDQAHRYASVLKEPGAFGDIAEKLRN